MQQSKNKETFKNILTYGLCGRSHCPKDTPALSDHICPFKADINGDQKSRCNCCELCTHECAMDI